jgi:hypothetical protein
MEVVMYRYSAVLLVVLVVATGTAWAKTITVTTGDSYDKIEAAQAGDTVLIEPGTYKFRVYLDKNGTAASPITIKAKDPKNRPVWDLGGKPISSWPGSYDGGDSNRGAWQVAGNHYVIESIIFRNCQDNIGAGLRARNVKGVTVRDCLFEGGTNGLYGAADDFVVEFCEFNNNGGNMDHNVYIMGGTFTLRYSYIHDSVSGGQNLHIRARQATIEYNWIARAGTYEVDMMSCELLCGGSGSSPVTMKMTLRGNVIVQGSSGSDRIVVLMDDHPGSESNDSTGTTTKMELTMINNTVVGQQVDMVAKMRGDTVNTAATMHNNIFYGVKALADGEGSWSVSGKNNWVQSGASTSGATGSITGSDPGFVNPGGKDYQLKSGSPCIGKAAAVSGLPNKEYYQNETDKLQYRPRATAKDVGAFEHGNTAKPVGPHGTPPPPPPPPTDGGPPPPPNDGSVPNPDGPVVPAGDGKKSGSNSLNGGCSCAVSGRTDLPPLWLLLPLLFLLRRRC